MVPLVECRGLTKKYAAVEALSAVDLVVGEGRIVGLLVHYQN